MYQEEKPHTMKEGGKEFNHENQSLGSLLFFVGRYSIIIKNPIGYWH